MLINVATVVAGEPPTGVTFAETGSEGEPAVSDGLTGWSAVPGCTSAQLELASPELSVLTDSSPRPSVTFSVKPSEAKPPSLAAAEAAKYSLSGLPVDGLVW